jgi:iron complex transport system substrate-binding protein
MAARTLLHLWTCGLLVPGTFGAEGVGHHRVVSLAPNLTQMISELGREERLVAVTPFCQAPTPVTRLPGGIQPEPERILGLDPDLVLATSMTPPATREQLTRMGVRVEVIDAPSLDGIREAVTEVAGLLDATPPAMPATRAAAKKLSAALLFGADTGYSAGCGTHAHEILEVAGLRNIAADAGGPWPQLGEEFLLASDPEVIVVADYGSADRESVLKILRSHPVRRHLTAVQAGRVVVFPAPVFSVPGPAALEAGKKLRAEVEKL